MPYLYVKKSRQTLKERIVYVMGESCCICGYNKSLQALDLHHLDPSIKDFTISRNANKSWQATRQEIEKCILVCANCHREIHAGIIRCPSDSTFSEERACEIDIQLQKIKHRELQYCKTCGKLIPTANANCVFCNGLLKRKVLERPSREQLKEQIRKTSFVRIGLLYGVTDNAIRKWCISMSLPSKKKEIKAYSEDEWSKI